MHDIHPDYLNISYNGEPVAAGKILVSEPFSKDLFFKRTVILLTEYSPAGAFGFILNRPLKVKLSDLLEKVKSGSTEVSLGGPVGSNTLHYLHTLSEIPESIRIIPGLYWSGQLDVLLQQFSDPFLPAGKVRFFLGYAGWSAGQLEEELSRNAWVVTPASISMVMTTEGDLWSEALRRMDGKYRHWANFPENPSDN